MSYPTTNGIRLQPCCISRLQSIRSELQTWSLVGTLMSTALWLNAISDPRMIPFTIASHAWTEWNQAIRSCPVIAQQRCRGYCQIELALHASGSLSQFWTEMYRSFGGRT
jgi:hypothetical protein